MACIMIGQLWCECDTHKCQPDSNTDQLLPAEPEIDPCASLEVTQFGQTEGVHLQVQPGGVGR